MNEDLRASLRDEFTTDAMDQGIGLVLNDATTKLRFEPPYWRAEVRDEVRYRVQVEVDIHRVDPEDATEVVDFDCGCPATEMGAPCEHLWALLIEVDLLRHACRVFGGNRSMFRLDRSDTLVSWKNRARRREALDGLPTFAITEHTDFARRILAQDVEPESDEATTATTSEPAVEFPPLPSQSFPRSKAPADWRTRASTIQVRPPLDRPPTLWHAAGLAPAELRWSLDRYALRDGQALLKPILRERRNSDGKLGAFRPIRPREAARRPIPVVDRQLLARNGFEATSAPPSPWSDQRLTSSEIVPTEEELGQIARDGRLVVGDRFDEALRWEPDPWRLTVSGHPVAEGGEELEVRFELTRHDDSKGVTRKPIDDAVEILGETLVLYDDTLAELAGGAQPGPLQDYARNGPFRIRRGEATEFLTAFAPALGDALIEGLEPEEPAVPVPSIDVSAPDSKAKTIPCTVWFDYDGERADPADAAPFLAHRNGTTLRHLDFEQRCLERFRDLGGWYEKRMVSGGPRIHRDAFLDVVRALAAEDWTVRASGKPLRPGHSASLRMSSQVDWFHVDGEVEFGDRRVGLPEILERLDTRRGMVRLDDGSLGMLPENWLSGWLRALEGGTTDGDVLRFPAAQALWIDALLAEREGVAVERDAETARRRDQLARFEAVRPAKAPRGFVGELRTYQRAGLGWLKFLDRFAFNGCLADDMGLGKTVQILALLEGRRNAKDREGPSLVVAPRSVIGNWCAEAARFAPKLRVLDWSGPDRWQEHGEDGLDAADLVVTTYGVLRRDAPEWLERRFDYAILDEAQAIKNPQSQTAKTARLLNARRRLALTGTPVENHLGELWSLFQFLEPGMLGSQQRFQELLDDDAGDGDPIGDRLRRTLRPFLLRRTKEAVLDDLPEKNEQVLHCELSGEQAKEYEQARQYFEASLGKKLEVDGVKDARFQVLEALLRLRQLACHVALVDEEHQKTASAKFDTLLPMLEEVVEGGHKALVFSQFTSLLGLLQKELDDRKLDYLYLDGKTRKRAALVKRFQEEPDPKLFLISLKAGGSGLNLTAADYVFVLDPWWNPAVEAQAIDRAHRIGQTRKVMAYRVIAKGTIEERVLELQERKRELTKALFEQKKGPLAALTKDDIEFLFQRG